MTQLLRSSEEKGLVVKARRGEPRRSTPTGRSRYHPSIRTLSSDAMASGACWDPSTSFWRCQLGIALKGARSETQSPGTRHREPPVSAVTPTHHSLTHALTHSRTHSR